MYSVRDELAKDPQGTVRAVAAMGYQGLEFYAPYLDWTPAQVQEMKG
jgi:sugar phosphate isomerase/epimerase